MMATCNDCLHNEMCYGTHTDDFFAAALAASRRDAEK